MVNPKKSTKAKRFRKPILEEVQYVNDTLLQADGIHTFIGQHHILQGVTFEAKTDGVTVLLGRNGAGKSTTLKTIMGLLPAKRGKLIYKGQQIQTKKPHQIARMGIGFVPENMGIFSELTVEENMQVAMLRDDDTTRRRLKDILQMFTALKEFWKTKAGNLSGGQKQMLAIARAIVNETSLLLIDEPTKGLAPIIINALIDAINQIKQHSVVLLVEQNLYMASQVGDHFYILDDGMVVHNGRMQDLIEDEELQSRYLGITQ
jgi:branched-chain amino acid transport system ATP-binding protein